MTKMLIDRSVVGQALEALECHADVGIKADNAITALRAALAQQAEPSPFGCVTVRRLSLRHENHADQYQFYPAGQSPYLDNVDECHIVYTAPPQQAEPVLQTCNCRWDGDVQVQQCTLHEAHVDAIHEWAERAKVAERKLAQQAEPVPMPPFPPVSQWNRGCAVCGAHGNATGYVCPRSDCPTKVTCGGVAWPT